MHPVVSLLGFWLAVPVYIWILGSVCKSSGKEDNKKFMACEDYEFEQKQVYPVSHIEKKTTVTNTTVTKEIIYFREGGNYIE